MDPWGLAWIEIFLPTDTLNGAEEETIGKRARDLNKWQRFRLENGKLVPVELQTGKRIKQVTKCEIREPKINIKPKPREVRAAETLPQKILLTLEVILRIFMKWK